MTNRVFEPRVRTLRLVAAGLMVWSTLLPATGAAAVGEPSAVPDRSRMNELRRAGESYRMLRVTDRTGTTDIRRPLIDSTGVRSALWEKQAQRRPALFVTADAPRPEVRQPIAWSEIEEIRAGRSKTLKGGLIGLVGGAFVGATVAAISLNGDMAGEGEAFRVLGIFTGGVLGGTMAGLVIGSSRGWHTVYRAQPGDR